MRAVWTFWSAPYRAHYHRLWHSEKHHILAWILSLGTASQHYEDTWLFTDSPGAELLIDRLGLPFRHVIRSLDRLDPARYRATIKVRLRDNQDETLSLGLR